MIRSAGIHLLISVFWLLLSPTSSMLDFFIGAGFGFIMLALFSDVLGSAAYVRRSLAFARFLLLFGLELLKANLSMLVAVLTRPRSRIRAGFIEYDVKNLNRFEILMLSHAITLTPGSCAVEYLEESNNLVLHLFDASDPETARQEIHHNLRDPILAFSRDPRELQNQERHSS